MSNRKLQPQSEDVMTKALVDYQTTQMTSIMLRQRMSEMQAQMKTIAQQLQALGKTMRAQRQQLSKVSAFRAREQAVNKMKRARNDRRQEQFRLGVQNAFQVTQKNKNWQSTMKKLSNARRKK